MNKIQKWEYKTVMEVNGCTPEKLDSLGGEGWELVGFSIVKGFKLLVTYIFKRPIYEKEVDTDRQVL